MQGRDTSPLIPELVEQSNRIETNASLSCLQFPIKSKSPPLRGRAKERVPRSDDST